MDFDNNNNNNSVNQIIVSQLDSHPFSMSQHSIRIELNVVSVS